MDIYIIKSIFVEVGMEHKVIIFYKFSVTVSLIYMKGFERDTIMYEKGQEAERKNTERERQRADFAEKEKIKAQKETTEALKRVAELEKILQCKTTEVNKIILR